MKVTDTSFFVIPAQAGIQVFHSMGSGFPFSRLRAEALQRAGTGMTSPSGFE
jgi:hypothetical protein